MSTPIVDDTGAKSHKNLNIIITVISVVLPLVVALLFSVKLEVNFPFNVYWLPAINAMLNGGTAILLVLALVAAKQHKVKLHSQMIYLAMGLSLVFLLVYVLYHVTTGHTKFQGEGTEKIIYLLLLFSHIALAAIQAPLVLFAFLYGYTGQVDRHKRLVKFSYPVWLYVSVTGVICYYMIAPYYPA
ncbi:DUF420 domain-containing protein [Saprospira grandis]|uniref:DUF420 domain-containing protein n=1 Tax=Saprospira grandis TaxID=1008 RepID=UPI0022DE8455|nr:DUF420 domain-containing protein [Saprospira grandis]WBM75042.1 DUF420 domain-containing protein [Saprospira grandis]